MFSKDKYHELLSLALEKGYRFIGFEDERPADADRVIYLRHDVDLFLSTAREIAEINHSLGIRGTFFIHLRSDFYNLRSLSVIENIHAILDLGQDIGLHFPSPSIIPDDPSVLIERIQADFAEFARDFPQAKPVFSWHNTTNEIIEWGQQHEVPELINAYARRFSKDIFYFSDSLAKRGPAEFEPEIKKGYPIMQLLFHPELWMIGGANLAEISVETWRCIIRIYDFDPSGKNPELWKLYPFRIPDHLLDEFLSKLSDHWLNKT
jgi:hypothetical protein